MPLAGALETQEDRFLVVFNRQQFIALGAIGPVRLRSKSDPESPGVERGQLVIPVGSKTESPTSAP